MSETRALVPTTSGWQELKEIATHFQKSGMCPASFKTPDQVISAIVVARDLGLPPSTVLQGGLYVVNGVVSANSRVMMGLILRSGEIKVKIEKNDKEGWVEVTMTRPSADLTYTARWDEHRVQESHANIDPKGKDEKWPWKLHRQTMKTWRAIAEAARIVAPDLIGGIYLPDEVDLPTGVVNGDLVIEAEVVEVGKELTPKPVKPAPAKKQEPTPTERWLAFLDTYDLTEKDALGVLGTKSVKEWVRLGTGRDLEAAITEIKAVMGL